MTRRKAPEPPWQVILEEIRSQNRATIEAVETSRTALVEKIAQMDQASRARDGALELALRDLAAGQSALRSDLNGLRDDFGALHDEIGALRVDVQQLSSQVAPLEPRIAALERRQP